MSATAEKYRSPYASVVDIELLLDCSTRTAERWMSQIKRHYGVQRYKKVTIEQVKSFLSKS